MEESRYSEDVRNLHGICDALKHLLLRTVILMKQSINQETKIEYVWEIITMLQI